MAYRRRRRSPGRRRSFGRTYRSRSRFGMRRRGRAGFRRRRAAYGRGRGRYITIGHRM